MPIAENIDTEAYVSEALRQVYVRLHRLPLIELPVFHSFLWFEPEPLQHLLSDLEAIGFSPLPLQTLTKTDEVGVETKFFEAIASRSSKVSIEALRTEASECLREATLHGVVYDHLSVETHDLEV